MKITLTLDVENCNTCIEYADIILDSTVENLKLNMTLLKQHICKSHYGMCPCDFHLQQIRLSVQKEEMDLMT